MIKFDRIRIRKFLITGAFFLLAPIAVSVYSLAEEISLTPPGLRPVKAPSLVIPAGYHYRNELVELPVYRDASGNPADGWSGKYINTRRFVSNHSAWIYFRDTDLKRSVVTGKNADSDGYRFWPVGATLVIESYEGNAFQTATNQLVEIDVMVKVKGGKKANRPAFHPVNWTYARFKPDKSPWTTSAKVRECHQCHSIAFHLTGDLIFTDFP